MASPRFTAEQDRRIIELYDELSNGKLACWDAIVIAMNNEFPNRFPRFTNDGLRSRHKRIKNIDNPKTKIKDIPADTHPFATTDLPK